jgi:hypothetical protein
MSTTMSTNCHWNDSIEKNILTVGEKAKGYKIMHIQESRTLSHQYNWLMYSGIALGPLSGLLSGIGAIMSPPEEPVYFPIFSTCVAFMAGIVVAVTKFGKFEEKTASHKLAASKYTSLESNITRQLSLGRNDRVNAVKYLEYIGNSFDELFTASPLIEKSIYDNYVRVAHTKGMIIPDEYELTIHIENGKESPVKEENVIKREHTLPQLPYISHFSDGRMMYEMQRMMK